MKKTIFNVLAAGALSLMAAACGPQDTNIGNGITKVSDTITGVVVREADATERTLSIVAAADALTDPNLIPVAGASIEVLSLQMTATSATDGTFEIQRVPYGRHYLQVDQDADDDGQSELASEKIEFKVDPEKPSDLGKVIVERVGTIKGRVRLAGAETGNVGILIVIPGTRYVTATDDAGYFVLDYVRKGTHTVVAHIAGYAMGKWDKVNLKSGKTVELPTLNLGIADPAARGAIKGRAYLADARNHKDITISLSGSTLTTRTGSSGEYNLSQIPEGIYQVSFAKSGYRTLTVANVPVIAGGEGWRLEDVYLQRGGEDADMDNDGIPDDEDEDMDGDGWTNGQDAFPEDSHEWLDTDGDGIGNNADYDDDNDGVPDGLDEFPLDDSESVDTDGDGIGDNADLDDDNDGTSDVTDDFPTDANEDTDTDGDGTGNNADTDDDGDGIPDSTDEFPLDDSEWLDTDGDGVGNNFDPDDDGDGTPDNSDAFPLDDSEWIDTDGDGTGNNADTDDDGDGIPDVSDAFPLDDGEAVDTDNDGTGNNADTDDDNDGYSDADEILVGTNPLSNASVPPAPTTTINGGPVAVTNSASVTFTFSSDSSLAVGFECRLNSAAYADCESPVTITGLTDGSYTYDARAIDSAGVTDATSAHWVWTVDRTAPNTTISSAPSTITYSTDASFAFSGTDAVGINRLECKLDTGSWGTCTSPKNYTSLSNGVHTFSVRAVDTAGNVESSVASHSWTVDTLPETVIDSGPDAVTTETLATFTFSSPDTDVDYYECSVDGGAYVSCVSPYAFSVTYGEHTFEVRGVDNAGNVDASSAQVSWTHKPLGQIPDTGISQCYDSSNVIACPLSGQAYYGQDSQYVINATSYTKNASIVIDNVTGLMWQRQDDDTGRLWSAAASYCETLSLDGFTDWRLPNKYELQSIANYGRYNPAVDSITFLGTESGYYWTNSTDATSVNDMWSVSFQDGLINRVSKGNLFFSRCVRQ